MSAMDKLIPIKQVMLPKSMRARNSMFLNGAGVTPISIVDYEWLEKQKREESVDLYRLNGLVVSYSINVGDPDIQHLYTLRTITPDGCDKLGIEFFTPSDKFKNQVILDAGYLICSEGKSGNFTWYALLPGQLDRKEGAERNYVGTFITKEDLISDLYDEIIRSILNERGISVIDWAMMDEEERLIVVRDFGDNIISMGSAMQLFDVLSQVDDVIADESIFSMKQAPIIDGSNPPLRPINYAEEYIKSSEKCLQHILQVISNGRPFNSSDVVMINESLELIEQAKVSGQRIVTAQA